MNRRNFLSTLVGGIAVGAAERTFPFRVFSFTNPKRQVWSFKNLSGILTLASSDQLIIPMNNVIVIATGEELDKLAGMHGIERKVKVHNLRIDLETDVDLRDRVCSSRVAFALPPERWPI
jgi:hypothetical protein